MLLTVALPAFVQPQAKPLAASTPAEDPDPPKQADNAATKPAKPPSAAEAMRKSIEKQRSAIGKQRDAARKQAELAGATMTPGNMPPVFGNARVLADCDPLADTVLNPLIEDNAKSQAVKPELLRAVMEQESGYRPCAISRKGAEGLMQLMPATAQEFGVADAFDPKENVAAGAKLLKQLVDKYGGDLAKALAAYNAGQAAVDQAGGIPDIQETREYVDAILKKMGSTPPAPPNIQMPKPIEN